MLRKGKYLIFLLVGATILGIVAWSYLRKVPPEEAAAMPVTLKIVVRMQDGSPVSLAAQKFAELIRQKSEGAITAQLVAVSVNEQEAMEMVKAGEADVYFGSTTSLGAYLPEMNLFQLPYLFQDREQVARVLDSPVAADLLAKCDALGLKGLAFADNGYRILLNMNKGIVSLADLQGIRVGLTENPAVGAFFEAVGAVGVPVPPPEALTVLQGGLVDGLELPGWSLLNTRIFGLAPYVTKTNHVINVAVYLMNKKKFASLTPVEQDSIVVAAKETVLYQRHEARAMEEKSYQGLIVTGAQINDVDPEIFAGVIRSVYEKFKGKPGMELVDVIQEAGSE